MSLLKSLKGLYKGWDGELTVKLIRWMYLWITASVSGKGGIWREKLPDAEPVVGAESPKVWATPALVRCTQCWHVLDFNELRFAEINQFQPLIIERCKSLQSLSKR